jgi:hypothetical protein
MIAKRKEVLYTAILKQTKQAGPLFWPANFVSDFGTDHTTLIGSRKKEDDIIHMILMKNVSLLASPLVPDGVADQRKAFVSNDHFFPKTKIAA